MFDRWLSSSGEDPTGEANAQVSRVKRRASAAAAPPSHPGTLVRTLSPSRTRINPSQRRVQRVVAQSPAACRDGTSVTSKSGTSSSDPGGMAHVASPRIAGQTPQPETPTARGL